MISPRDLAGILRNTGLIITGQGMTAYEAMYLGVPFVMVPRDRYHLELAWKTSPSRFLVFDIFTEGRDALVKKVRRLRGDRAYRAAVTAAGRKKVDGLGVKRTAALILGKFYEKRGLS